MTAENKNLKLTKKTIEAHKDFSEENKNTAEVTKEMIDEAEINNEKEIIKKSEEEILKEKEIERAILKLRPGERSIDDIIKIWKPRTKLGKEVKEGKIKNVDEILDKNKRVLEHEIIDKLIPNLKTDLLSIGQSKGKFGGGKRRAWRQTQRKTKEGNVPTFSAFAVAGDENGHVGIGYGRSKETLPARDKAIRKAKLNITKISRACASFDCDCEELHTVPFKVEGKGGSSRVILIPAPQGTGIVAANELKKILKLAGIKDVYSKTFGTKATTFNLAKACIDALSKTNSGGKK